MLSTAYFAKTELDENNVLKAPDGVLEEYLFRESGALQQVTHTKRALKVAADPVKELDEYEKELKKKATDGVAKFKSDVAFLLTQGIPSERAESLALQKIKEELQREMSFLSLAYPLINDEARLTDIVAKVKL